MNRYHKAALMSEKAYDKSKNTKLTGGVEYICETKNRCVHVAVAGTNGWRDWVKNVDLRSERGLKRSSYMCAMAIWNDLPTSIVRAHSIEISGHSLGGTIAEALFKIILKESFVQTVRCYSFAAPPGVHPHNYERWDGLTCFRDPGDDPVDSAGILHFKHPSNEFGAKVFIAEDDKLGWDVDQHGIENWIEYTKDILF